MTLKPRVKIYRDENGQPKGDASICYAKNASVGLALQVITRIIISSQSLSCWPHRSYRDLFSKVLDGSQLRVNVMLKVKG